MIVVCENEIESLYEAILAADVDRVSVARENKSELLHEARSAADVESVIVARENESDHCLKRDKRLMEIE